MPLKHRNRYFKMDNAGHLFSQSMAVCMSGIQLQLMMIQKTGNNTFGNVNVILKALCQQKHGRQEGQIIQPYLALVKALIKSNTINMEFHPLTCMWGNAEDLLRGMAEMITEKVKLMGKIKGIVFIQSREEKLNSKYIVIFNYISM